MNDRRTPSAKSAAGQGKARNPRHARQQRVDRSTQVPNSFAVDNPNPENAALAASFEVVRDQIIDLLRPEGVQIEHSVHGQFYGALSERRGIFWPGLHALFVEFTVPVPAGPDRPECGQRFSFDRSAGFQPAVSPTSSRPSARAAHASGNFTAFADWKSAIQQTGILRYAEKHQNP